MPNVRECTQGGSPVRWLLNGGLEMAVQEALGGIPAWVSEIEPGPSRILAQRYPGVPNIGDVTAVDWAAVEPVDIITGGSPCQDLSQAGKRAGMKAGTRSGLWASMCDAIETIRPSLVVWENVRGALSAEATPGDMEQCELCVGGGAPHLRALGRVLGDLAELGYDAAWTGIRAADVGAPHERFRVFVLAWPADATGEGLEAWGEGRPGGGLAGLGGRAADLTLLRTPTAQLAVNGGSQHPDKRKSGGHGPTLADEAEHLLPTPRATDGTKGGPNQRGSSGDLMLPSAVLLPTPTAVTRDRAEDQIAERRASRTNGLNLDEVRSSEFGQYAPAIACWETVLGRPAPAPTEPTGKGGAHRLAPRFVEFMMGLPDGWVTDVGLTRNEQLKALGNGVVPQQATAAIRHLLAVRAAALTGQEVAA